MYAGYPTAGRVPKSESPTTKVWGFHRPETAYLPQKLADPLKGVGEHRTGLVLIGINGTRQLSLTLRCISVKQVASGLSALHAPADTAPDHAHRPT
jgi:hypothetical protein